ncbi:MAG: hypothetical protein IGS03_00680 [Candidatus Sericytochromatia bacterium]|nr:hypothetical protein [Candidatus Sericytochromatia bacterium]
MTYSETDLVYVLFADDTGYYVHCTVSVAPNYKSEVTQHEVEQGANISDHIHNPPVTLSMTQFMSELVGQEENEEYDPYFVGEHITLHERLIQARNNKELLSVDCGPEKGIFGDMAILDYSPSWDNGGDGKSLNYTLSLQEISLAETKTRDLVQERAEREQVASFKRQTDQGQIGARPAGGRLAEATAETRGLKSLERPNELGPTGANVFRGPGPGAEELVP